jgi:hypothetical protein
MRPERASGALLFEGLHPAIAQRQNRLDLKQAAHQRLRAADATALLQVFQRVDQK